MSFCRTKLIIIVLILMASIEKTSSNNRKILRRKLPKKVPVQHSYADLLNSLIKVNQERVTALKKLYVLNSATYYGKDVLRSTIDNKLEDYDKIQERLIRTLEYILDNLEQAPKASIDGNDLDAILQDHDHIFVLPIENYNNKEQKIKNALRNKDFSVDSSKENDNDKSDPQDDSKSSSSEKLNEESLNEVKGNDTQGRSLYYYGCGRGRLRCYKACKEAYREACDYYYCRSSLRSSLRSACKNECISWFY